MPISVIRRAHGNAYKSVISGLFHYFGLIQHLLKLMPEVELIDIFHYLC
jgi:hypothetical protein